MADLQWPNVGNALNAGATAAYNLGRSRREADAEARRQAAQQFIEPAIKGDTGAFARLAGADANTANAVGLALSRMDAATLAKAKVATDYAHGAAAGLINAPEGDRERLYQMTLADARARGMDTSRWPANYDHAWTDMQYKSAVGAKSFFENQQQNQRQQRQLNHNNGPMVDLPDPSPTPPQGDDASSGAASGYRPPVGNTRAAGAIGGIESGGQPNGGYGAIGPAANAKGNRAYGKYQVMDFNVGPWTQEFIGRAMTPQEFLANPEAQNRVFEGKFGQYVQKYGSAEAAARAWFAGEGGMNNPNARDVLGTTVASYGNKFNAEMGSGGSGGGSTPAPGQATYYPSQPLGPIASPPPAEMAQAPTPFRPPTDYGGAYGQEMGTVPSPLPPQGGDPPARADASGNPLPPTAQPQAGGGRPEQLPRNGAFATENPVKYGYIQRGRELPGGIVEPAQTKDGSYVYRDPRDPTGKAVVYYNPRRDPKVLREEADAKHKAENPNAIAGAYAGTDERNQARNIVLNGDPATPLYASAYGILTQEQAVENPVTKEITRIKPDISSWARPPTYSISGAPPSAGATPPPAPGSKTITTEPGKGKPLDLAGTVKLGTIAKPALEMSELLKSLDPSFGGFGNDYIGDLAIEAMRKGWKEDPKKQADWWERYSGISNIDRNELFGASLTEGEKAEWKKATVTTGMKPDQIRSNIERQKAIAEKVLSRIANSMVKSDYRREAIEDAIGMSIEELPNPRGGVPQAPAVGPSDRPPLSSFER